MQQQDTHSAISGISRIVRFFALSQDQDSAKNGHEDYSKWETADDRLDCGGFNEAFIVQSWTGYNPHH